MADQEIEYQQPAELCRYCGSGSTTEIAPYKVFDKKVQCYKCGKVYLVQDDWCGAVNDTTDGNP